MTTTFLANDLEIQEAMDISEGVVDALDEEEKIPIDESVRTIISGLSPSDWFYTLEEDQDPVEAEEEQDPVGGLSFPEKRERLSAFFLPASERWWLDVSEHYAAEGS
jgi:hypothetical protein